jgi:hypothetical protein
MALIELMEYLFLFAHCMGMSVRFYYSRIKILCQGVLKNFIRKPADKLHSVLSVRLQRLTTL